MKRTPWILAGLISAGIASISFAQPGSGMMPGCDGMGPMGRPAAMRFDPAERAGRHLDFLKSQLKLTPEQEPLWQAYAEKVQAEAGKARPAWRAQAAEEKLTAPERMAKMASLMEERLAAMKAVHESFNRLYAALTPEQKAIADQHWAHIGQGGRPGPGPGRKAPPQG